MTLINEYFDLVKKYESKYGDTTVVLMQVGAFFEVYGLRNQETSIITGSQIDCFTKICDLNIADKKSCVGKNGVVMAGFSLYMIDKYLKKMQEAGYTVVVYTQDEQNKNTTRSLAGIYSPGTFFSPESQKITNNITCIWINKINMNKMSLFNNLKISGMNASENEIIHVGVGNIDIFTGSANIFQYKSGYNKNPTTYDELERFISIHQPMETIIIGNITYKEMDDVVNFSDIQSKKIHRVSLVEKDGRSELLDFALNCEKQTYQKEIIERFYSSKKFHSLSLDMYENEIASRAFCFLLDFVNQHDSSLVTRLNDLVISKTDGKLQLANHSLSQLNIIDNNQYDGKYSSVLKMLNNAVTPMGKRQFAMDLVNPTTNIDFLNGEYEITEHMLMSIRDQENTKIHMNLSDIKDISKLNRQLFLKKVSPKQLYQLHKDMTHIENTFNILMDDDILKHYVLKRINEGNYTIQNIDEIIESSKSIITFLKEKVDLNKCKNIETCQGFDVNFINKGVNEELDVKHKTLLEKNDLIDAFRGCLNMKLSKYEDKKELTEYFKVHETEKGGFGLIGTKRRCKLLKKYSEENPQDIQLTFVSSFDGKQYSETIKLNKTLLTVSTQNTSNDYICTPQIQKLCSEISSLKTEMKGIISKVYIEDIIQKLQDYQREFDLCVRFTTLIDVLMNKMNIAKKYNYCKPQIDTSQFKSFFKSTGLRHCLIENIQQDELYVANDITLGASNGDNIISQDGVLLYGTNAVGKTSFIRAIGIAIVMAQAGLYVPCSSFAYYPYTCLFTRILGNDNLFKGLSTFAVEMSELRTILRLADGDSLILGDELCSGTESISAQSIFVAGVQQLIEKKSSFVFATHLHEIVNFSEIQELKTLSLKHMEVIYNQEEDVLVYDRKLKNGPGVSMYGLEVCRSLNLPDDFLKMANKLRVKYHPETGSMFSLKQSHYNSKKIISMCEVCKKLPGVEIHHLQHQKHANDNGFIINDNGGVFHKNATANLVSICEKCHDNIHKKNIQHKKVKTTNGVIVEEI